MFEKICQKLEERSSLRIKKKFESQLWGKIKRKLPSRSNILMLQKLQESKSFHFHFNKRRDTFLCDFTKIPLMDLTLLLVSNPWTLYGTSTPFYDVTISGGYFDHEHLQIFLNVLGRNILSLTLEFHEATSTTITNGGPPVETTMNLPTLLLIQVPNIEQLRIKNQPSILKDPSVPTRLFANIRRKPPILVPTRDDKGNENIAIPVPATGTRTGPLNNLKYFCFYSQNTFIPSDILDFILKEAKLLRYFDWSQTTTLNEMYLPILQTSKKLHLLRLLQLNSFEKLASVYIDMYKYGCGGQLNQDEVEEIKKYPALEELSLVEIYKFVIDAENTDDLTMLDEVSRVVTGILAKSASSLRYLSIPPLGNLPNLNWPVFKNLIELTLAGPAGTFPENVVVEKKENNKFNPNIYTPYFPRDYIFSKTFPSLKSIKDGRLVNPALSRYPWKESIDTRKYGAHHHQLPNVVSLDFTKGPILSALPSLVRTFQNLTCLKVGFVRNVRGAMRNFVEFNHLKTLVFGVLVNCEANQFPALDAALTGYSKQVCLRLFASSVNTEDSAPKPATWMIRQKQKSILNLTDLRSLEICLVDMSEDWEEKYRGRPIITHLSGFLGFKKCQKLETVKIWIHSWGERLRELKKQCVQVKPFVTSISAPHASLLGI